MTTSNAEQNFRQLSCFVFWSTPSIFLSQHPQNSYWNGAGLPHSLFSNLSHQSGYLISVKQDLIKAVLRFCILVSVFCLYLTVLSLGDVMKSWNRDTFMVITSRKSVYSFYFYWALNPMWTLWYCEYFDVLYAAIKNIIVSLSLHRRCPTHAHVR